jgi:ankyrin repeat protein
MITSLPYYIPENHPISLLEIGSDLVFKDYESFLVFNNYKSFFYKQLLTNPVALEIAMAYLSKEDRIDFLRIRDSDGDSLLHFFINAQTTRYLLMNGASADVANKYSRTPLESSILFYLEISDKSVRYLEIILTILNASNVSNYSDYHQERIANFIGTLIQNLDGDWQKILLEHPKTKYLLEKREKDPKELELFRKESEAQNTKYIKDLESDFEKQKFGYDLIKSKITPGSFYIYFEDGTINWIATGAIWYLIPLLEESSSKSFSSHYLAHYDDITVLDRILYQIDDEYVLDEYINSPDINGNTPLHLATYFLNSNTANILLLNNADFIAINSQGQTPLDIALDWALFFYNEKLRLTYEAHVNEAHIKMISALSIAHEILNHCTVADIEEIKIFNKINDSAFLRHEFKDCKALKDYKEEYELEFLRINFENRKLLAEYRKAKSLALIPKKDDDLAIDTRPAQEKFEAAAVIEPEVAAPQKKKRNRGEVKKAKRAASKAISGGGFGAAVEAMGGGGLGSVVEDKIEPDAYKLIKACKRFFEILEKIDEKLIRNKKDKLPSTPIEKADLDEMQLLLKTNIDILNSRRLTDKSSPLLLAVTIGDASLLSMILETAKECRINMNEFVNAKGGEYGATAICLAAINENSDIMKMLIDCGADPRIKANTEPELSAFDIVKAKPSEKRVQLQRILNGYESEPGKIKIPQAIVAKPTIEEILRGGDDELLGILNTLGHKGLFSGNKGGRLR